MAQKLANDDSRFYSPTKMQSNSNNALAGKVKLNTLEKMSLRIEQLKKEDTLLNYDIVDHFWQKMQELKAKLNIPNLEPIAQCLKEDRLKVSFSSLISGTFQDI